MILKIIFLLKKFILKINNTQIKILANVIKLGFKRYKILYALSVISIFSILVETLSMSFLSSISGNHYLVFNSFLSKLNPLHVFIIVLVLFLIRFVSMSYIESRYIYVSRSFQHYLSTNTFKKILSEKLNVIEKKEVGYFISMAGDEASKCSEILNSFLRVVNAIFIGFFYFFMILYFDFNFLYVLLLFFLINYLVLKNLMKKIYNLGNQSLTLSRSSGSLFLDAFNSLRTIKSFGVSEFIEDKYSEKMLEYQMTNFKIASWSIFNKIFPVIILFSLLAIYVVIDLSYIHKLNITYVLALFFMLMRLLTIIGELFQTSSTVISNLKLTNDIISFSEHINTRREGLKLSIVEKIQVNNISFSHDNRIKIFKNLNIEFVKGNSYAIIGKTGSGKSSLLDLIMNFNVPSIGEIKINNISSLNYNESEFINKILYVGQDSMIFNDTVLYNLQMGGNYKLEKINHTLKLVDLFDTIYEFKDGINHQLNYRGTNISGGQKQRLNLVRALLRAPEVLILDESVNALDSDTRLKVVKNLLSEYRNKIIIFVTHDKDILSLVDNVINLDLINKK